MRQIALPSGANVDPVRHGGLHHRPADLAGGRLPRHAGGGALGRPDPPCARHQPSRQRGAEARCRDGAGRARHRRRAIAPARMVEVWNKIDLLAPGRAGRALGARPAAATGVNLLSAAEGTGLAPAAGGRRPPARGEPDRGRARPRLRRRRDRGLAAPARRGAGAHRRRHAAFISRLQSRHPSAPSSPTSSAGRFSRARDPSLRRGEQRRQPKKKQAAEDRSLRVGEETPQVGCRGGNPRDTAA